MRMSDKMKVRDNMTTYMQCCHVGEEGNTSPCTQRAREGQVA